MGGNWTFIQIDDHREFQNQYFCISICVYPGGMEEQSFYRRYAMWSWNKYDIACCMQVQREGMVRILRTTYVLMFYSIMNMCFVGPVYLTGRCNLKMLSAKISRFTLDSLARTLDTSKEEGSKWFKLFPWNFTLEIRSLRLPKTNELFLVSILPLLLRTSLKFSKCLYWIDMA